MKRKQKNILNSRRPQVQTDGYFRRNAVVISRAEREVAAHKQTVSQRQIDAKRLHSRKRKLRVTILIVCVVLIVMGLLRFRISSVAIRPVPPATIHSDSGGASVSIYRESTLVYIDRFVPLKQSWLLDESALEDSLKQKHPEVQSINIESNLLNSKLTVQLQLRKPAFVLQTGENSLFIDDDGVLFGVNHYRNIDTNKLPMVEDYGSGVAKAGDKIVTRSVAEAVAKLYKELPDLYGGQTQVSKLSLPRSAREVYVGLSNKPYIVKFIADRPIDDQIGELRALLAHLTNSNQQPNDHIDVRIAGKAFYK